MKKISELIDLSGRRALVTGGAGHIGRVVCETLLELGARVGIIDKENVVGEKGRVFSSACDLLDVSATRYSVKHLISEMGGLDIVIHCAAYVGATSVPGWAVPFDQQSVEAWDAALRVNLTSSLILAQECREALTQSKSASMILFSSIYGMVGPDMRLYEGTNMANPAGYCASKGGVVQMTKYLATLLAPTIRVNAISPGGVWRNQPELFHERYINRTPLGRMAIEEDLKGAVAYLSSDLSSYVTGHNLVVDGGWTTW